MPGARLRQVSLWVGEHTNLEAIEYGSTPEDNDSPPPNNHLGAEHVCFLVDNVKARKAELEAKGVEFSDINVVDEGPLAGWRWVYFSDPDGLALELVEMAYYLKEEQEAAIAEYLRSRPSLEAIEAGLRH